MVEYYEKINRLILDFIERCREWDTPLHSVGVAEAVWQNDGLEISLRGNLAKTQSNGSSSLVIYMQKDFHCPDAALFFSLIRCISQGKYMQFLSTHLFYFIFIQFS